MQSCETPTVEEMNGWPVEEVTKAYARLLKEFNRMTSSHTRLMRNIDQFDTDYSRRLEVSLSLLTGVIMKRMRRRSITIHPDDFAKFAVTSTVRMKTIGDGAIEYTLEGSFDE